MNKTELKGYFERDLKYRETCMVENIDGLITQADCLKKDLEKAKNRLADDSILVKGHVFDTMIEGLENSLQGFNLKRANNTAKHWEESTQVLKALAHLDENKQA